MLDWKGINHAIRSLEITQSSSWKVTKMTLILYRFPSVYAVDDVEDQLHIMNSLITDCINRHAPLKRCKFTRPPAPWLKDLNITELKRKRDKLRYTAHQTQSDEDWVLFRKIRNKLKSSIKSAKTTFLKKALSSKRTVDVWKIIHRILKPSPKTLQIDPETLNKHYLTTANRLLSAENESIEDLRILSQSLQPDCPNEHQFKLRKVTYKNVESQLKRIRMDCSAGYDNFSMCFI